jgi:hypothetical protein
MTTEPIVLVMPQGMADSAEADFRERAAAAGNFLGVPVLIAPFGTTRPTQRVEHSLGPYAEEALGRIAAALENIAEHLHRMAPSTYPGPR